jgi:hypothetical protein
LAPLLRFARPALLGLALFPVGFATHETMHLLIYTVSGVRAALVVTRWSVGVGSLTIAGLHAAPLGPAGVGGPDRAVPLWLLVLNNGLGPLLAAAFLLLLWASVSRRSRAARAALLANAAVLAFFSLLEVAYPLLEDVAGVDADVLLLPAVNYGGALLVLLGVTAAAFQAGGGRRPRVVDPGPVDRPARRLPAP